MHQSARQGNRVTILFTSPNLTGFTMSVNLKSRAIIQCARNGKGRNNDIDLPNLHFNFQLHPYLVIKNAKQKQFHSANRCWALILFVVEQNVHRDERCTAQKEHSRT